MAFPQVISITSSSHNSVVTNHVVTLPTLLSGELAVVFFATSQDTATGTFPGGWTKSDNANAFGLSGAFAYRICDGTEGASITVTSPTAMRSAHQVYRIQGHGSTGQVPQGTLGGGAGGTVNPGALTPTGGAKDYLWLVSVLCDDGKIASATDGNFTNLTTHQSGTGTDSVGVSGAQRELNAASLDPGNWTVAGLVGYQAIHIAVHPGTEGNPTGATVLDPFGMRGFFGG